jgi:hypothetical protein
MNTLESVVNSLGGNQYRVTIKWASGEETQNVDLDGYDVISDDDYEAVESAGLLDDYMISPSHWDDCGETDFYFKAALEYAANYSGFNAEEYISENKQS